MSPNTIKSYRDAFKIFLPFAAKYYGIKIKSLRVEHISSELIIAFLQDLEQGVNGRDKLSQKWSFKSEPVWKRKGNS
jgi:hypothetical protein